MRGRLLLLLNEQFYVEACPTVLNQPLRSPPDTLLMPLIRLRSMVGSQHRR